MADGVGRATNIINAMTNRLVVNGGLIAAILGLIAIAVVQGQGGDLLASVAGVLVLGLLLLALLLAFTAKMMLLGFRFRDKRKR
jgi:uncharacterized membrane protein